MRKLLWWLFWVFMVALTWDFLTKEIGVIQQAPAIFAIALILATAFTTLIGYWILEKLYRGQINALEGESKNKDSQIKLAEQELELAIKKIEAGREETLVLISNHEKTSDKPPFYLDVVKGLSTSDIQVLEEIERFERANPVQPNKIPSGCDRKTLTDRLDLAWNELEAIINNLERLKLVEPMYVPPNAFQSIPIKLYDDRPLFLTAMGREFLKLYRLPSS